jgi:beta-lactamase class A
LGGATLMITVSDNVATNLIIDRLGMDAIQMWIDKAGVRRHPARTADD